MSLLYKFGLKQLLDLDPCNVSPFFTKLPLFLSNRLGLIVDKKPMSY